jgi:hypothetical protein
MASKRKRGNSPLVDELWRWLCFNVAFGLFPLAFHFIYLRARSPLNASIWPTVRSTLGEGELFLISCCIAGAAIGERLGRHSVQTRVELLFSLWCLLDILGSASYYTLLIAGAVHNTGAVATHSVIFFILTVLPSAVGFDMDRVTIMVLVFCNVGTLVLVGLAEAYFSRRRPSDAEPETGEDERSL